METLDALTVTELAVTFGRVYDRCPSDVKVIHSYISDKLKHKSLKRNSDEERYALVGEVFREIFPDVVNSPVCRPALERMVHEYAKLPSTPATSLEGTPNANTILLAVAFGLGAGGVIVGTICLIIWAAS